METKVKQLIEKEALFTRKDRILIGVSGDVTPLLFCMCFIVWVMTSSSHTAISISAEMNPTETANL